VCPSEYPRFGIERKTMEITDVRATTVTVPLEAPLLHANGAHWRRFVRTIVEVETDEGLIGLGEMGGGGESAELAFDGLKYYLVGHDPSQLEALRFKILNPTASLYNNRTQLHAAIEFACLDVIGQALGVPVCDLLGGRLRDEVPFASTCSSGTPTPRLGKARSEPSNSWSSTPERSRKGTASPPTSSKVGCILRITSSGATGLWPTCFPRTPCATTRTVP
jgi:glucarate dehydratase